MGIDARGFAEILSFQAQKKVKDLKKSPFDLFEDDSYGFDYDEIVKYTYANDLRSVLQLYQHFGMDVDAKGVRNEFFDLDWQVFNSDTSGMKGENIWKKLCKIKSIPEDSALYGMTQNTIQEEYENVLFVVNGEQYIRLVLKSVLKDVDRNGLTTLDLNKWGIEYKTKSATYASMTKWSTVFRRNVPMFVKDECSIPLLLVRGEVGRVVKLR